MRLLANENFPGEAVQTLRGNGHDIAWVREDAPGSTDRAVLARAVAEKRVLITFDKDFGELAFHAGLPAVSGVILFRIPMTFPAEVARRAAAVLAMRDDWTGFFAVVEQHRLRLTPLPPRNGSA